MRRIAALSSVVLAGCAGQTFVAPADDTGPMLVIDVANESASDMSVGNEYEFEGVSGAGEGLVPACRRETLPLASIQGDYRILVDGKVVHEGVAPAGRPDTFFVVRVHIDPDGQVEVMVPGVMLREPIASADIPGCRED